MAKFLEVSGLETYHREYRNTGNPIYVWAAYRVCRKHGFEIPEWVYEFFDNACDELEELHDKQKVEPKDFASALGFVTKGRGNPISSVSHDARDKDIAFRALVIAGNTEALPEWAAVQLAEEFGTSEATVRRAFDRYTAVS